MGGIQIVTDSTAAFDRPEIEELGLEIVPLSIHFNGETFDEGLPETYAAFYEKLRQTKSVPSTSQPAVDLFYQAFLRAREAGKESVAILLSGGLSGTVASAQAAAEMAGRTGITVIDSATAGSNLKYLVRAAHAAAKNGGSALDIERMTNEQSQTMFAMLTVDDLIYLKLGGRLNNTQYFVGKLLNILPLIMLREGRLFPYAKVQGSKAVLSAIRQAMPDNVKSLTVLHTDAAERAFELQAVLRERFPDIEIGIEPLSPVIGSHLGPGALGCCYY